MHTQETPTPALSGWDNGFPQKWPLKNDKDYDESCFCGSEGHESLQQVTSGDSGRTETDLWELHTDVTHSSFIFLFFLKKKKQFSKIRLMICADEEDPHPPKASFKMLMFGNIPQQFAYKISNLIAIMTQFCVIFKPELQPG